MNHIILNLLILRITLLYYIILHLALILLIIYNILQGRNDKVKLERSRLWQLDNSRGEAYGEGGSTIQSLFSSYLHFL